MVVKKQVNSFLEGHPESKGCVEPKKGENHCSTSSLAESLQTPESFDKDMSGSKSAANSISSSSNKNFATQSTSASTILTQKFSAVYQIGIKGSREEVD